MRTTERQLSGLAAIWSQYGNNILDTIVNAVVSKQNREVPNHAETTVHYSLAVFHPKSVSSLDSSSSVNTFKKFRN